MAHLGEAANAFKMHTHGRKNPCVQLAWQRASSVGTGSCEGGIFINLLMLLTLCPSNDSSLEALWLEYLIGQGGIWRQSSTVLQMNAAVRAGAVAPGADRRCSQPSQHSRLCSRALAASSQQSGLHGGLSATSSLGNSLSESHRCF